MHNTSQIIRDLQPWFHNIHLPDGTQTAPDHFLGDFPSFKWKEIAPYIPEDLSGCRVLDVGCNAGFYSIELAKRGAKVTAIDIDRHYLDQADWVAQQFDLDHQIVFKQMQVYDLAGVEEEYDLIWFMGVFYHLRYPLLALDILGRKCKDKLVFQTLTLPGDNLENVPHDFQINDRAQLLDDKWPKMAFVEHQFAGDPTNWWLANQSCMQAMLRSSGFRIEQCPLHETIIAVKDAETASIDGWNKSEYLSATQQDWQKEVESKTRK